MLRISVKGQLTDHHYNLFQPNGKFKLKLYIHTTKMHGGGGSCP
jgi:hypothetical protein